MEDLAKARSSLEKQTLMDYEQLFGVRPGWTSDDPLRALQWVPTLGFLGADHGIV